MANKKYDMTVSKAISTISNWCNQSGYQLVTDGPYVAYIKADSMEIDIKNVIKDLLMSVLDLSKKKVNSLISILITRGRVYILFKKRMHMR